MVSFVLVFPKVARQLVRKTSQEGLHWNLNGGLPIIETEIDLLMQSSLASYFVSQSIPTMTSNSFIDRTIRSVGRFWSFKLREQSLHTFSNLTLTPRGDTAFKDTLSVWGTKPKRRTIPIAIKDLDTPVSNRALTWLLNNFNVPSSFCYSASSYSASLGMIALRWACPP